MPPRRLLLLTVALLLLGLMAAALLLALDGASPTALLPGSDDPAVATGTSPDGPDAANGEATERGGRRGRRAGRITGDVRDLRSREAAPGRVVTLTLSDGDIRQVATDGQGGFAFGDVPPDLPHELRVDGDDHVSVVRPGLFLRPGQRLDVGTLWLADGVRVAFEVRSFDGRPLGGATVRAFAQGPGSSAFDAPRDPSPVAVANTDRDGVAHFEGLPPGTWTFTAERGGYARRGLVGATIREGVAEERFRLALERGYRLDGRVLDALGEPVSGAPVLAIRRTLVSDATTAPLALRTTTDRDGRFVFGALPAADVVLWSGWPRGRLAVLAAVRLPGVESLDLVLLRGGRLEGRVTRADDDQPIAEADVFVSLQVLGAFVLSFELETDHDGRYAIDLPMPGAVTGVSAEKRGYRTRWADIDELAVPTGALVTCDLELERGGVITGRVIGPDGPLAGAEVGATNPEWYFSTTSDREGRFELNGLPRERFFVLAALWGHVMPDRPDDPDGALRAGTAPAHLVVDLGAVDEAEVEIPMQPGGTLRGVVETHEGSPAAGAVVSAAGGARAARTTDDGSFELGPLEHGEIPIEAVAANGGARGALNAIVPAPPDEPAPVTIRLGPELHVRGRLSSASGAALEGAYVQIVAWDDTLDMPVGDEWSWLEATRLPVNADGTFEHVVDGTLGTFVVRAGALGHRRARSGRLSLTADRSEAHVDLELATGVTFTGRVLNLDGEPVPGAFIASVAVPPGTDPYSVGYPGAWGPPIVAVADRHGVFRMDGLDTGPHALRAWAAGHLPDARVVSVPEDSGATFEIVAALSIEGVITYEDGTPVVGARVEVGSVESGEYTEGRTDADGRYVVHGLERGMHTIAVSPSSDGRQNLVPRRLEGVMAGAVDAHVEVERGRTISGRVLDAAGTPVAGAQVMAQQDDLAHAKATTDADGAFTLGGLAAGRFIVIVECDPLEGVGRFHRVATAGDGHVDIRLPELEEISGVLVGRAGQPLAACELQFAPREGATPNGVFPWWRSASTAGDGSFSVRVAPAAEYVVALPEHPYLTLAANTTLTAGERGARLVASAGESIRGRVVDADGNGVADLDIRATGGGTTRVATSDANGTFMVRGLQAGTTYELWPESSDWTASKAVAMEAPAVGVVLRLKRLRELSGRVIGADGTPLASATIEAAAEDGSSWTTWSADDGSFHISGLPEGEYTMRVDRHQNGDFVDCGTARAGKTGVEIRAPR